MRRIIDYFSLWHTLLALSLIIMVYLITIQLNEALSYSSMALYFNQENAHISWQPSEGIVDHYLLEITDTHFFSDDHSENALTVVKYISSKPPCYQLKCEHHHSYKVRVKAVTPSGICSAYSDASVLFICDRKNPEITLPPLSSPRKVRHPTLLITGSFEDPHLCSITVNGKAASIDPVDKIFKATVNLEWGGNFINIVAQDLAGNVTTRGVTINYTPITIISLPPDATLYWNGNHAYRGIYSGTTPRSYNQAVGGTQVLRLTHPGFNDYYGIIDFSDLSKDIYTISLTPFSASDLTQIIPLLRSQGKESEGGTHSHPFVVDYDMDGRKDLLLGTQEGKIALFINSGTESTPHFLRHHFLKAGGKDINVGTHAAPFIVDYNNDGAEDLLVGSGAGLLLYYSNQGSTSEPSFTSPKVLKDAEGAALAVDSYCTPCVVDWNEDHRKDIVLGSGSGTLLVYLNQGSDSDPVWSPPFSVKVGGVALDVGSFAAPFVADWNGDGRKDLLVGDGEGYIHLYRNSAEGTPQFIRAEKVQVNGQELMVEGSAVPFLVDWDHNGTKELLIGGSDGRICLSM